MYYNNKFCNNCGKIGHVYKTCTEPIMSMGIICVNIKDTQKSAKVKQALSSYKNPTLNILHCNAYNTSKCNPLLYINDIKFLIIQRKHSLGYIEFIRGNYSIYNYKQLISLFEQMTSEEIDTIANATSFDHLWNNVWKDSAQLKIYAAEFNNAREKFNKLKYKYNNKDITSLEYYTQNIEPRWAIEEWGFPKGRRHPYESDKDCAVREFKEETHIVNFDILNKISTIHEMLIGTNKIQYKHIYYIALYDGNTSNIAVPDNNEIGDISWCSLDETIAKFRCYHTEKLKIINEVYTFISNLLYCC